MKYSKKLIRIIFFSIGGLYLLAISFHFYEQQKKKNLQEPSYACGSFGGKIIKIHEKYLALGIMHYEGIDYRTLDFLNYQDAKGCLDQVSGLTIEFQWPTLEAWDNTWDVKEKINIVIRQNAALPKSQDRKNWNYKPLLMAAIKNDAPSIHEYKKAKEMAVFNEGLQFYELKSEKTDKNNNTTATRIYWRASKEDEGMISSVIRCEDATSTCNVWQHLPNLGANTSYMAIQFHKDLLPHWNQVLDKSLAFINSSIKN